MRYYKLCFKEFILKIKFNLFKIIYNWRFTNNDKKRVENFFKIYAVYKELSIVIKEILAEIRLNTKKGYENGKLTEDEYKLLCAEFDESDKLHMSA